MASVAVYAQSPQVITNIAMVPWLTIESQVGWTNQIQYSTNLSPTNWTALTNLMVTQSPYWFFDVGATSGPQRFYRFRGGPSANPVNQAPTLDLLADLTINENAGSQTVNLSGITSGAPNEGQTLTVTASSSNTGLILTPAVTYTSPNTTGSITFAPFANAYGQATITVTVNDGSASNNLVSRTFTVTVNPVNQPPTLDPLADLIINENAGSQAVDLSGISSGAANEVQTLTVTASSSNRDLIPTPAVNYTSPNGAGSITITPVPNAHGQATITVTVNDGGTSNNIVSRAFTVTIDPVNQPPTLDPLADLAINENAGSQTVNLSGISSGAANEVQTLTVTASSSNTGLIPTPAVNYTSPNTTGSITFIPVANAFGQATITVTVNDGGASNNIVSRTFTVAVNQASLANMVPIPGGSFIMGDTRDGSKDAPTNTVTVSPFEMDQTEVPYDLWLRVYQYATTNTTFVYSFDHPGLGKASNYPVESMNWYDAVKWCNARSEMEGLTPCYYTNNPTGVYRSGRVDLAITNVDWNATGYRLPTEAEWERAARGGVPGHRFPWTNTDYITRTNANYAGVAPAARPAYDLSPVGYNPIYYINPPPYASPVISFPTNPYGLYNMAGNVAEWCWDWYKITSYTNDATDPRGPLSSPSGTRVMRGGSWNSGASDLRCASRTFNLPTVYNSYLGFRCVRKPTNP
jgi:formylglycine-generating enzyme required for sulfatase activity